MIFDSLFFFSSSLMKRNSNTIQIIHSNEHTQITESVLGRLDDVRILYKHDKVSQEKASTD